VEAVQTQNPIALPETIHPEQRLKLPAVQALTGLGKTKIYAAIKAGNFPAPERDGPRCSRWRAADVLGYLQGKREPANEAVL
jgi:prophage regulatory protein